MITKEEFKEALKIVKNYNIQLKEKNKPIKITEIILIKENESIFNYFNDFFYLNKSYKYSELLKIIYKIYENEFNKKIGRNNRVEILKKLIERKIIIPKGENLFKKYYLNYETTRQNKQLQKNA